MFSTIPTIMSDMLNTFATPFDNINFGLYLAFLY